MRNTRPERKAVADALVRERQRISRELHDRALQILSSVRLRAEVCRDQLVTDQESLRRELKIIEKEIDTVILEIRNILAETQEGRRVSILLHQLRPSRAHGSGTGGDHPRTLVRLRNRIALPPRRHLGRRCLPHSQSSPSHGHAAQSGLGPFRTAKGSGAN